MRDEHCAAENIVAQLLYEAIRCMTVQGRVHDSAREGARQREGGCTTARGRVHDSARDSTREGARQYEGQHEGGCTTVRGTARGRVHDSTRDSAREGARQREGGYMVKGRVHTIPWSNC